MPEEEKVEVMPTEEEQTLPVEDNKVETKTDNEIEEILEKIQDIVAELADLVAQATQLQASDVNISEEIEESLKGIVRAELNAFKDEIVKAVKEELISLGIPESYSELKRKDEEKAPEGTDKVEVSEKELGKLEPEVLKAAPKNVTGGEDELSVRMMIVEKIMKGEIKNPFEAYKYIR